VASAPSPRLAPLLASQHEELGIGGQNFPYRILEFTPGFDAPADVLDPVLGNVLDMLFAPHHESERPDRMAGAVGTMAGGLAATQRGLGQGAGEQIVGKLSDDMITTTSQRLGQLGALTDTVYIGPWLNPDAPPSTRGYIYQMRCTQGNVYLWLAIDGQGKIAWLTFKNRLDVENVTPAPSATPPDTL